jgi:hypothetical protein
MKTIKTTKTKTTDTPKIAVKAAPAEGLTAPPARKRSAKISTVTAPVPPTTSRRAEQPQPAPRREITTELIAARAYILWEQQGRPHGCDLANWLLAERQLKGETHSLTE